MAMMKGITIETGTSDKPKIVLRTNLKHNDESDAINTMSEQEHFDKENEIIVDIIKRGQFINAQQGIQIGEWIAEGLTKGLTQPIDLPKRLEGSD